MSHRGRIALTTGFLLSAQAAAWTACGGVADLSQGPRDAAAPPETSTNQSDGTITGPGSDASGATFDSAAAFDAGTPPEDAGLQDYDSAPPPLLCAPTLSSPPQWTPPTTYPRAWCTGAEITSIVNDCFFGSAAACNNDLDDYPTCAECILTQADNSYYGPLIEYTYRVSVNYGGCFALELHDSSDAGCGAKLGTYEDCIWRGCIDRCFGVDAGDVDGGSFAVVQACDTVADDPGGLCAAYLAVANAGCPGPGTPAYEACYAGATVAENMIAVSEIFCTTGDGGAGEDGGADASVPDAGGMSDAGPDATADAGAVTDAGSDSGADEDASDAAPCTPWPDGGISYPCGSFSFTAPAQFCVAFGTDPPQPESTPSQCAACQEDYTCGCFVQFNTQCPGDVLGCFPAADGGFTVVCD